MNDETPWTRVSLADFQRSHYGDLDAAEATAIASVKAFFAERRDVASGTFAQMARDADGVAQH